VQRGDALALLVLSARKLADIVQACRIEELLEASPFPGISAVLCRKARTVQIKSVKTMISVTVTVIEHDDVNHRLPDPARAAT